MAGPVKRKSTGLNTTSRKKSKLVPSSFQFYDLNDDCLILLFKCYDTVTLAKMARTCNRFHHLITAHIIPFRTMDFSTFRKRSSVRNIFDLFGKSMTRIVVHQNDIQAVFPGYSRFAEILRLIVEYGQPGKLKEVNLKFGGFCHVPGKLLRDVAPHFANVQKLEFNFTQEQMHSDEFTPFLKAIDKQNLRELRLHNVVSIGDWLSPHLFASVQKIHLCFTRQNAPFFWNQQWNHDRNAMNENRLINFLARKPTRLLDFECIDAPSDGVFVELSRHNPSIERLGEIQGWPNDAAADNNNNNHGGADAMMNGIQRWDYLKSFTHLKDVSLKSSTANFSDLGRVFSILAKHQTVEELHLNLGYVNNGTSPVHVADLKRLTRLTALNLLNFDDSRSKEFVNSLFANLPALTSCTIDGKHPTQERIIELIKSAPNLKVLKFICNFSSFSVPFYKKLVKCRAPPDGVNDQEASEENRLVIQIDRDNAQKCLTKLGNKRYGLSIVMLQGI